MIKFIGGEVIDDDEEDGGVLVNTIDQKNFVFFIYKKSFLPRYVFITYTNNNKQTD